MCRKQFMCQHCSKCDNDNGLTIVDTSQLYSISVCTRMYLLLLYSALYLATQLASFSSLLLDNIFDRTLYTRHLPFTHARAEKSPEALAMRCILLAGVVLAFQLASMCHVSAFVSTRPPHVSGHVSAFLTPCPLPLVRKAASARARRSRFSIYLLY